MARLIELSWVHSPGGEGLSVRSVCVCVFAPCLCRCEFPAGAPVSPTIIKHMYNINIQSVPSTKCTNKDLVSENGSNIHNINHISLYSATYMCPIKFFFYNKAVKTSCQAKYLLF